MNFIWKFQSFASGNNVHKNKKTANGNSKVQKIIHFPNNVNTDVIVFSGYFFNYF